MLVQVSNPIQFKRWFALSTHADGVDITPSVLPFNPVFRERVE